MKPRQRISLHKTHPNLYAQMTYVGVVYIGMGINFWRYPPTFNPWGINRIHVAIGFAVLGISQLVFLHLLRHLRLTRIVQSLSVGCTLAWGLINTQQTFVLHRASLQVPLWCLLVSLLTFPRKPPAKP